MRALTLAEKQLFDELLFNTDLVLMATTLDGKDVAVVGARWAAEGDTFDIEPLAILINEDLFSRLVKPE